MTYRIFSIFLCAFWLGLSLHRAQAQVPPPAMSARAWLLIDVNSNMPLAASNADERIEPASLTKLMTAYLVFTALKQGTLKPEQTVPVSQRALKAPGSRMFIDPKLPPVTVAELIRGMVIQSGNDASIALAEAVAGSEEAFVGKMNLEARRLGLSGTQFMNATGLPDPGHYSTARDLARLAQAVIRDHPDHYPLYGQKEYTYNKITQHNRNRLLWLDPSVDGIKTGYTEAAGFCLVASSKHGPLRLVAVVLGTGSDNLRAQEAQRLLTYGFQNFAAIRLYQGGQTVSQMKVFKGGRSVVNAGFAQDLVVSLPKDVTERLKVQMVSQQPLLAPIEAGQRIGTLKLSFDQGGETRLWGEFPVVALEAVPSAGVLGRAWDTLWLWFR